MSQYLCVGRHIDIQPTADHELRSLHKRCPWQSHHTGCFFIGQITPPGRENFGVLMSSDFMHPPGYTAIARRYTRLTLEPLV